MAGKKELIADVAKEMDGVTKKDVEQMLGLALASITRRTGKGEKIIIKGFGTFQMVRRKQKKGRNPQTGEDLTIAAHDVLVLKGGGK